jgi:hypothetical protein
VYDPAEMAAWQAATAAVHPVAKAAAEKAAAEAKARRASKSDVAEAYNTARSAAYNEVRTTMPKPIRFDVNDEPIRGHENEPMIAASGGRLFQPFGLVFIPMVEPSKRIPLRAAVETTLGVPPRVQSDPSAPGVEPDRSG